MSFVVVIVIIIVSITVISINTNLINITILYRVLFHLVFLVGSSGRL